VVTHAHPTSLTDAMVIEADDEKSMIPVISARNMDEK